MIYGFFVTPRHQSMTWDLFCLAALATPEPKSPPQLCTTAQVILCLEPAWKNLMTAWWLPDYSLMTTQQLLNDYLMTARQLYRVQSLPDDLQITAWQLHLNGTYSTPELDQWIKWELMALYIFTKFLNIWSPLSENTLDLKGPFFLGLSKTRKVHYLILYNKFIYNNPWTKSKYIMQKDSTFHRFILFLYNLHHLMRKCLQFFFPTPVWILFIIYYFVYQSCLEPEKNVPMFVPMSLLVPHNSLIHLHHYFHTPDALISNC